MPRSVYARSAVAAAAAMTSFTTFAFGQATAPPSGEEPPTLAPVVVSATRGERSVNEQYVADGFSGSLGAPRQFSGGLRVTF